jgi:hypothetical protein
VRGKQSGTVAEEDRRSSVSRNCASRIFRRIWPLVLLFFSNWACAISVDVTPVTILPNGTGQFTFSWTGTSFNSELQESTNGGSNWSTASPGHYDHGSVTLTRQPGIWWYRIKHCYFTPPGLHGLRGLKPIVQAFLD